MSYFCYKQWIYQLICAMARKTFSNKDYCVLKISFSTHILENFINNCRPREGVVTRAQTAFEQKQRSKSEKLPNPRPVTTLGTKNRILATSQSDSKATTAKSQTTTTKGCKVCQILY